MKKMIPAISFFLFMLFLISCDKENVKSISETDDVSSVLSEQSSPQLRSPRIKRQVQFKDESGENSVVFSFEASSEDEIDAYLKNNTFRLRPVFSSEKEKIERAAKKVSFAIDSDSSGVDIDINSFDMIFMSKTLQKGAVGYAMQIIQNSNPKGRGEASINATNVHESWSWCEYAYIYANGDAPLSGYMDTKWRWYSGWSYNQPISLIAWDDWWYDIDGPVKARATITCASSYHFEWIDLEAS